MVRKNWDRSFRSHGIEKLEPLHEAFDPHLHEAVDTVRRDDLPKQTVAEVSQIGFLMDDRVLRPARVVVNLGPPEKERPADRASTRD